MKIFYEKLEKRDYQLNIFEKSKNRNTLVVLPTGLGKTVIALLLSEYRLNLYPESKVLFLAPTRPLVLQHENFFREFASGKFYSITGYIRSEKRKKIYEMAEVIFATPQTIKNDILSNRLTLENFSLVIFDEAHKAVGRYPYTYIAMHYKLRSKYPLILALTATPGNSVDKIREVCKNLYIQNIEYRRESSFDVRKYIKEKEVILESLDIPEKFLKIKRMFYDLMNFYINKIRERGYVIQPASQIKLSEILKIQRKMYELKDFESMPYVGALLKLYHAYIVFFTQSPIVFRNYLEELISDNSKSSFELLSNTLFRELIKEASLVEYNPKFRKLIEILEKNKNKKIIIFVQLRNTAKLIVSRLKEMGYKAEAFLGQKEMSQRKQQEILRKFRSNVIDIIVATSIGEEGLHIPEADIAIFYEPVPSVLRSIQRKGRVGRTKFGKIYIVMMKKSPDENIFWAIRKKEKKLYNMLEIVKKELDRGTKIIDFFN